MKPIDDKAKDGNWIVVPRSTPIDKYNCCPFVLVRWLWDREGDDDYGLFVDGFGSIHIPETYFKLI